jgi:hypothetical protein
MIERFNFYDLYGYLIPGFVALALAWLPFALVGDALPSLGLADALTALVVSYVIGHVLYGLAAGAFPSGRTAADQNTHLPSDDVLDPDIEGNSAIYIDRLKAAIKKELGIDLDRAQAGKERLNLQKRAFLECRAKVISAGTGAYVEQFEGMYSLMRGLAAAAFFGSYYFLGWIIAPHTAMLQKWAAPAVFFIGVLFVSVDIWQHARGKRPSSWTNASWRHWPGVAYVVLTLFALSAGALLGFRHPPTASDLEFLMVSTPILVFVGGRCHSRYRYFTKVFADAVYRDFMALSSASTADSGQRAVTAVRRDRSAPPP